ncbi:MAG: OmpA family protein [Myxococcota bacterium]
MHRRTGLTALALAVILGWSSVGHARPFVKKGGVEVGVKMGGYFFLDSDSPLDDTFAYGVHGGYNFSRLLGAELGFDASPQEVNDVSLYHLHLDVIVHPLTHDWVVPFVGAGPTFATLVPDRGDNDSDPGVNAIAGLKIYPWEHVGVRLDARYVARFGTGDDESTDHDLIASFGLFATFGGADEQAEVLLDTDGDGFLDDVDACPTVPGVESADGCPDRDGDGLRDDQDRCPDEAGPAEHEGCPDGDGDGIVDVDDACPEVPGVQEFEGCPDTDGDDIADPDDRCPKIPGEAQYQGCPPPPPEEVTEKYTGTIQGITFKVDSAEIREQSFPVLDEAVQVLGEYPQLRILVEGHTSSEGERDYNMELSRDRAESVKQYLVSKGIAADRVETKGFGPDRPVAPNDTEAGRKQNRRIEFKILRQ